MKNMRLLPIVALIVASGLIPLRAQEGMNPVVMEIGGQQIRQAEFMKEFETNVGYQLYKKPNLTFAEKQQALLEYADLYAIFRAKLFDAKALGFDTTARLKHELARYRKDLAAPYLIDSAELRRLLYEAYERNHYSLQASHILVAMPIGISDEDTLGYFMTATQLYQRIVEGGEDFNEVAKQYALSRNPTRQLRPDEGNLGYFSVFDMVYPFETAAYSLKVGEVSKPVRTRYGYHIIKLTDRIEGLFGKVTMGHIWLSSTDSASRKVDIDMMYRQIQEGSTFEQIARQSDDKTTASSGGILSDARLSQLPPEYIHKLQGMKEGEVSKPFFTQYGWHIIKLIKKDTLPSIDNLEAYYKQRMARDQRGDASRKTFAKASRQKYGIVDCTRTPVANTKGTRRSKDKTPQTEANLNELLNVVPDSVRLGKWAFDPTQFVDTTALVVAPNRRYTSYDVGLYIYIHQKKGIRENMGIYLRNALDDFTDSIAIDYADSQLENEYPEFKSIVDEYRRGLMMFNYNDSLIWRKAQEDTLGFIEFYKKDSPNKSLSNPDDSVFFYHKRARITLFNISDSAALPTNKAIKILTKAQARNTSGTEIKQQLLRQINHKKFTDDVVTVTADVIEYTKQNLLKDDQWQSGVYARPNGRGYQLIAVDEILPPSLKGHLEARGYYLNAWQNEIERQLVDKLRIKYNVKINYDALRKIAL